MYNLIDKYPIKPNNTRINSTKRVLKMAFKISIAAGISSNIATTAIAKMQITVVKEYPIFCMKFLDILVLR